MFALSITSKLIPQSHVKATQVLSKKEAMDLKVEALVSCRTWTSIPYSSDANIIMCKWVFKLKYHLDGTITHHKAFLVGCGFTQTYGINYTQTFSLGVRFYFSGVLLSLMVNKALSLHHLDVSNAFLYGDHEEQVFME